MNNKISYLQYQYKLYINSVYPIIGNQSFMLYDKAVSDTITHTGKNIVSHLLSNGNI